MKKYLFLLCLAGMALTFNANAQTPTTNPKLEVNKNLRVPTIQDLMARLNKMEEDNKKLRKDLDDLKANYDNLNTAFKSVKNDNAVQALLIKGLTSNVGTIKTDLTSLQTSFNSHYHKIKGGFSAATADDYTMHLVRSGKSLHDDVETFKTTGGPLQ